MTSNRISKTFDEWPAQSYLVRKGEEKIREMLAYQNEAFCDDDRDYWQDFQEDYWQVKQEWEQRKTRKVLQETDGGTISDGQQEESQAGSVSAMLDDSDSSEAFSQAPQALSEAHSSTDLPRPTVSWKDKATLRANNDTGGLPIVPSETSLANSPFKTAQKCFQRKLPTRIVVLETVKKLNCAPPINGTTCNDDDVDTSIEGDTDAMEFYHRKALGKTNRRNGRRLRPDELQRKQFILQKKDLQRRHGL